MRRILVACSALSLWVDPGAATAEPAPQPTAHYRQSYLFSSDWFTMRIPLWNRVLGPIAGAPDLNYLEVGLFEGRSAIWMLENVLTHPSSRLTGIDIFVYPPNIEEIYSANIQKSGFADKVTTLVGKSGDHLKDLPQNSFDIIYIDGHHHADFALADAVLSWPLLKDGGLLIFDDYRWLRRYPEELKPALAIDSFISIHRNSIEVVHADYQIVLKKRKNRCRALPGCSPFGQYVYYWPDAELRDPDSNTSIEISESERILIERLIKTRTVKRGRIAWRPKLLEGDAFVALKERLKLEL